MVSCSEGAVHTLLRACDTLWNGGSFFWRILGWVRLFWRAAGERGQKDQVQGLCLYELGANREHI